MGDLNSAECDLNQLYYDQISRWSYAALGVAVVGLGFGLKGWGCGRKVQRNCTQRSMVCGFAWTGGVLGVVAIILPFLWSGIAAEAAIDEYCGGCATADCSAEGRRNAHNIMASFGT